MSKYEFRHTRTWPALAARIGVVLRMDQAKVEKFFEAFGGTELQVPRAEEIGPDHELVRVMGQDDAVRLAACLHPMRCAQAVRAVRIPVIGDVARVVVVRGCPDGCL